MNFQILIILGALDKRFHTQVLEYAEKSAADYAFRILQEQVAAKSNYIWAAIQLY